MKQFCFVTRTPDPGLHVNKDPPLNKDVHSFKQLHPPLNKDPYNALF